MPSGMRCVNDPPTFVPTFFCDRVVETRLLNRFVTDPKFRLLALTGPNGIGKTAMVARWRDDLRKDDHEPKVDAFVYLSAYGVRPISSPVVLDDLRKAVADPAAVDHLSSWLDDADVLPATKLGRILDELQKRTVLVIDDGEALLDATGRLRDPGLDELIRLLIRRSDHGVKLIFVSSTEPARLLSDNPTCTTRFPLDSGLQPDHDQEFLGNLDEDGALGLRSPAAMDLARIRSLTGGRPHALEALYMTLCGFPETSLSDLLDEMARTPPDKVTGFLIGRAFNSLGFAEMRVVEMLAAYRWPVPPAAVDHLLKDYFPGMAAKPVLDRLAAKRVVRKCGDRFHLPPEPDGDRVLSGIPMGSVEDRDSDRAVLTRLALWRRAADYFETAHPQHPRSVEDMDTWFAEIDLRIRAREYDRAYKVIAGLDNQRLRDRGHSGALASWREDLVGKLSSPEVEAENHCDLGRARAQQEDDQGALDAYRKALPLVSNATDRATILLNIGKRYYYTGYIKKAAEHYETAMSLLKKRQSPPVKIGIYQALARYSARVGDFDGALKHLAAADRNFDRQPEHWNDARKVELILDKCFVHELNGEISAALDRIEEARDIADRLDRPLLSALVLTAQAELLIDAGQWESAVRWAKKAVAISAGTRGGGYCRDACQVLALAHLYGGELEPAQIAADAAAQYRMSSRALTAVLLQGVIAFLNGEPEKARPAFQDAHLKADTQARRDDANYQAFDTDGVARCGLFVCGDRDQFDAAVSAFDAARQVTCERGAWHHPVFLVEKLMQGGDAGLAERMRRAASGQ